MNLQAVLGWTRAIGLSAVFGLVACDSGEKKTEETKVEETKTVEVKVEETKTATPPVDENKAVVADTKAADPAGDAKAEDTKAGDAKAEDTKAGDAKADTKVDDAKKTDAKKTEPKKTEDKAPSADGKALYESKCKVCHAPDGKGTAAMKKNNIPDMSDKGWQGKHSKAAVVKSINEGVDGTKMKAFKDKLKPEEVDAIAAYVKKMK